MVINLSLPRESGVLNYETAISDCPDRTYVLKGSYAVLHRESKVFRDAIWRRSGLAPTLSLWEEPTASPTRYDRGRTSSFESHAHAGRAQSASPTGLALPARPARQKSDNATSLATNWRDEGKRSPARSRSGGVTCRRICVSQIGFSRPRRSMQTCMNRISPAC